MEAEYADLDADEDLTLDGVWSTAGRGRDGGDGGDDRFKKFECESDYSDEYGEYGVTDTDVLKARSRGFKIRNIDSSWWGDDEYDEYDDEYSDEYWDEY